MIALVVLGAFIIMAAYRLRQSAEQRSDWHLALAISAIVFVIYAARDAMGGIAAGDCDFRIAVLNNVTVP